MAKALTFTYLGNDYTLEFNRSAVQTLERQGFILEDCQKKPMTYLPQFFAGSFLMHHSGIKREKVDEIYSHMKKKEELFIKLIEMYNDTINTLVDDPEESEGNITWGANW